VRHGRPDAARRSHGRRAERPSEPGDAARSRGCRANTRRRPEPIAEPPGSKGAFASSSSSTTAGAGGARRSSSGALAGVRCQAMGATMRSMRRLSDPVRACLGVSRSRRRLHLCRCPVRSTTGGRTAAAAVGDPDAPAALVGAPLYVLDPLSGSGCLVICERDVSKATVAACVDYLDPAIQQCSTAPTALPVLHVNCSMQCRCAGGDALM
ncbi:unnamed protein product, partial [Urochloa humidicola]